MGDVGCGVTQTFFKTAKRFSLGIPAVMAFGIQQGRGDFI
jgi:hypothetical protein